MSEGGRLTQIASSSAGLL